MARIQSQEGHLNSSVKRDNFIGTDANAGTTVSTKGPENEETKVDTNLRDAIIDRLLGEKK